MDEEMMLVCTECGVAFSFSAEEQAFYKERGFENGPKRCAACRMSQQALEAAVKPKKEMYPATCAACGCQTELPFKPKGDKPVYCSACLQKKKKEEQ